MFIQSDVAWDINLNFHTWRSSIVDLDFQWCINKTALYLLFFFFVLSRVVPCSSVIWIWKLFLYQVSIFQQIFRKKLKKKHLNSYPFKLQHWSVIAITKRKRELRTIWYGNNFYSCDCFGFSGWVISGCFYFKAELGFLLDYQIYIDISDLHINQTPSIVNFGKMF